MESTGKITINFEQEGFEQYISVTQYDTGKKVRCNIAGISGNIGAAMVYCKKPSGLETYTDANIVDDHTVEFYITEQMNAEIGCAKCQLQLFGEDKSLTSYKFKITVQENMIANSRVTSADDYPAFRDSLEKFTGMKEKFYEKIETEKTERQSADNTEKSERQAADAAEKSERMQEIAVERARIDNLVSNNNPTEGNSELIDIRVGADGKRYDSAGEAVRGQANSLYNEIEEQKIVSMASVNPYKVNLEKYDAFIVPWKYLTGRNTSEHIPTYTQQSNYNYDVIDIKINPNNTIVTVPYDTSQSVGQAFVLYTKGVLSNNITPDNVNKKQAGVIEVGDDSYTVDLNASKLNYERVAFTVPKGRRNLFFKNPDEGELGKIVDEKIITTYKDVISDNIIIAPVNMFYSIGAIGDSYTAGSVLSSDGKTWQDVTDLSWIATIAKRAGIYYSNYGKGGATTKSYITDKLPDVISGQAKDLYFIALGINDCLQGVPIGTIEDIKSNYTENGKTYYGYYGSIISQVQNHAPKSKIILIKIWTNGEEKNPYDNAIEKIAEHFNIPIIDPFDDIFFNSSLYLDNMVSGHPTTMGYACMGIAMERLFSKCVADNPTYFKYSTIG